MRFKNHLVGELLGLGDKQGEQIKVLAQISGLASRQMLTFDIRDRDKFGVGKRMNSS